MKQNCTVYKMAKIIGKKWALLVLLCLYNGQNDWKRFSQLKQEIGDITPRVLSQRLKELESEGFIANRVNSDSRPIKSEYKLTEAGQEFIAIIKQMKDWALKWKYEDKECEVSECKACECFD